LHEIFREGWQWVNEQMIKFWWRSRTHSSVGGTDIMTLVRRALTEVRTVPVLLVVITAFSFTMLVFCLVSWVIPDRSRSPRRERLKQTITGWMPFLSPSQQCQSTDIDEGKSSSVPCPVLIHCHLKEGMPGVCRLSSSVGIYYLWHQIRNHIAPECGQMPNVMAALRNIGGALCWTLQSLADARY